MKKKPNGSIASVNNESNTAAVTVTVESTSQPVVISQQQEETQTSEKRPRSISTKSTKSNKKQKTTKKSTKNKSKTAEQNPFDYSDERIRKLFAPLHFPEGITEEQKKEIEEMYRKETLQVLYQKSRHKLLTKEHVQQYYNEETLKNYASQFQQKQRYNANINGKFWDLEEVFPIAEEIFQSYRARLERRHLPETIILAKSRKIAHKTILRGVSEKLNVTSIIFD